MKTKRVFLETEYYDCAHLRDFGSGIHATYAKLHYQPGVKFYPLDPDLARWEELPVMWEGKIGETNFVICQFRDKEGVLRMDTFYALTGKPLCHYFRYVTTSTIEECILSAKSHIAVYGVQNIDWQDDKNWIFETNSNSYKPLQQVTTKRINFIKFKLLKLIK